MSDQPPERHAPPHIRLNSGSDDLLNTQQSDSPSDSQSRPQTARTPSSRSLIPSQSRPGTAPSSGGGAPGNTLYQSHQPAESAELLLPPRKSKKQRYRDDESIHQTPSGRTSRRTSWSSGSDASRDSRAGPFASPFDESRAPSRAGSDDEGVNTQTVSEKYNILPSAGLLLFPEDVEKDDYLHNPDPNDRDKMIWGDLFSKRGLANVGGLMLITMGILILFIGYPILTFVQGVTNPGGPGCAENPLCIDKSVPLMKNIRTGLIDPDTPSSAMSKQGENGMLSLVFSDEFNDPGRTFYEFDDPFWQGVDIWYGATQDLEWYDPDAITTQDGYLAIRFDAFQNHNLNYRSGMLQSWNKLCFKGGMMEASISLPGKGDVSGFWPGFWAMGNLGRPGYLATTDGMWPFSYHDECDAGVGFNQSDPDGLSYLPAMRLPACTCAGQNHPSPGLSRSAPEIDAIEATVDYLEPPAGDAVGSASQSFQIAPFDVLFRPDTDFIEVYNPTYSRANAYQGGPFQQALSALTFLNNDWYDGQAYQSYGFEYQPGADGFVSWHVGSQNTWKIDGRAIGPNGNIGQRVMPEEPMSIIANFGMAPSFAAINYTYISKLLPATMRIDYIRIYQDEDGEMTCDPEGYPSTAYIAEHPKAYLNPNNTQWSDAGYSRPLNSFIDSCSAGGDSSNKLAKLARRERRNERSRRRKRSWMPWG